MRLVHITVVLFLLSCSLALGQRPVLYISPPLHDAETGNGNGTVVVARGFGALGVYNTRVSSWDGTLNYEGSIDGTNFFAIRCRELDTGTIVTTTSAEANQVLCSMTGLHSFRARISGATTGSTTVTAVKVDQISSSGGGDILTSGSDGDSSTVQSDSGLELIGGAITMLRGCADNEILKWDETQDDWNCEADAGAAGGDSISIDSVAVVDPDFQSGGDIDFVDTSNVVTANINANTVNHDELAATITLADADLLDMSNISVTSATEGLFLPQHATDCSTNGTAEGQVCWEADANTLYIGDGATVQQVGGAEVNDLSAAVTWANVPDANVDGSNERDEVCGTTDLSTSCEINADVIDFADIKQDNTLGGNPAFLVDECFLVATASGGGLLCEGSTANTNEQLYLFPDVDGADTTNRIVVDNTEVTSIDGTGLTISGGELTADLGTAIDTSEITDDTITFADISDSSAIDADTTFTAADGIDLTLTPTHTSGDTNFFTLDANQTDDAAATDDFDVMRIEMVSESGDAGDTFEGLVISQEAGTANTVIDAAIRIENLENAASTMTDAIKIEATTADAIVDAIDVSDAEITNAINIGDNPIVSTSTSIVDADLAIIDDSTITLTSEVTGTLSVANGGTGATTLTDGGILLGSGTGAITALGAASNGEIPIGDGTTDPVLATISATANETEITNGTGSITVGVVDDLVTNSFSSNVADPADAGVLRLGNAETVAWEASPAGTDETLTVSSDENFQMSGPLELDASDPADSGALRLDNNEAIAWEASPAGTDVTITVNANEAYVFSGLDCSGNTNGGAITADASGVLSCTDDDSSAGSGAFSDAGDPIVQNTTTKDVHVGDGAGTLTGKLEVGGDADQPQVVIEGHSTQTDDLLIIQQDDDTELFSVSSSPSIKLREVADAPGDTAAYGQIWVNTATPNELFFTDDEGTDTQLTGRVTKSIYWSAGALSSDGTNCADPSEVTINSGPKQYSVICTDNDSSRMHGAVMMDGWDAGTVTFEVAYIQTAADTNALNLDVACQGRGATETVNATYGTEVAIDDAAVTGSNAIDMTTSAAVTCNCTTSCQDGDMLFFYIDVDATGTTTAMGTVNFMGVKMEYTWSQFGD